MDFGAFVRLSPRTEGLVHISEFAPFRIASVKDAVTVGEVVKVIVKEIDEEGRVNLSIKKVDPEFASRKGLSPATDPKAQNHHGRENTRQ
ncbi:polyribonucleotide nucleotidyltransferase, partial [Candidatus Kaiserbacteria bacterium CG10_big_fil_rev_8_21_14_0_10_45_20]